MSSRFEKTFQRWMSPLTLKEISPDSRSVSLGHLPASAQAFVLAALARQEPKQTFLALVPGVKAQEELANDLEAWEAPHLFFPQVEAPTAETLPDPEASAERLSALTRLGSGFCGVVLTTERAADQSLPKPEVLKGHRLKLVKNTHLDRDKIFGQLEKAGYTREAQ